MVAIALGIFLYFSPGAAGTFRLSARAKITMETARLLPGYFAQGMNCSERHITLQELRQKFATYHELKEMELHDGYMDIGCVIEGEIFVDGKKYHYTDDPVNLLFTTWPDGKPHELGGRHSDMSDMQ